MKKYCINSICVLIYLLISTAFAQNYHSKNISTKNGLPSNCVYNVIKSNDGTIWAATEAGVSSIKEREIKNYTVKQGLPHNNCWQIIEDNNNQIWVGTFGGGVSYLDGEAFKTIDTTTGLCDNKVRKLHYNNNQIYVGTQKGFSIIDIKLKRIISKKNENFTFQVMDFFEYKNNIYVVTYRNGIYKVNDQNLPIKISSESSLFSAFVTNDSLILSKDGNRSNRKSIYKTKIDSLNLNQTNFKTFGNSVFWDYTKSKNILFGAAWGVNFETGGLFQLKDSTLVSLNKKYSITSKNIYSLFFDNTTKQLLVATLDNGIYVIDLDTPFSKYKTANLIDFKKEEGIGNIFLNNNALTIKGENNDVSIVKEDFISFASSKFTLEPKLDVLSKKLRHFEKERAYLNANFKLMNIKIYNGFIYIRSSIGIFKIKAKNTIKIIDYFPISAHTFLVNSVNEIFIQKPYSFTIKLDSKGDLNTVIDYPLEDKNNPRDIFEFFILENRLIGISRFSGIYAYEKKGFKSYYNDKFILENEFTVATKVSENELILSNYSGDIFSFKSHKEHVSFNKIISVEELSGTIVKSLQMHGDNLIIGTNLGLNIINLNSKTKRFFNEEQGLNAKNILETSVYKDSLFVTTSTSIDKVDLIKITNNTPVKLEFFLDKFIVNETIYHREKAGIIQLKSKQNNIDLNLGIKGIKYPEKISYRYAIKGLKNTNWSDWLEWSDNKLIKIPYLPAGSYSIELEYNDFYSGSKGTSTIVRFNISQSFWSSIWFYILVSLSTVVIVYTIFKYNFKKAYKRQKKKYELEKRVRDAKAEALSSQMNPHFIFNAISAIQNYVISNDIDNSLSYIDNFSKLIRQTLDYSSKKTISIQQEIDFLKLYIKIQNLRFGNKIRFKVNTDIGIKNRRINPMLLQPIIENCFEHAFNDTIASPKIDLNFEQIDTFLKVTIIDNGIGICKKTNKKSKGLKLVEERLKLLHLENKLHLQSTDKETTVTIELKQI